MNGYAFTRQGEDGLILVNADLDGEKRTFGFDTGATQTVVDLNLLLIHGYSLDRTDGSQDVETANGVISAHVFHLRSFQSLGILRQSFKVCSFDFLAQGISPDCDGFLGLDLLADTKTCIDFRLSEITVS